MSVTTGDSGELMVVVKRLVKFTLKKKTGTEYHLENNTRMKDGLKNIEQNRKWI